MYKYFSFFPSSQLQQVIDSFIIYAAQETMTNLQGLPSRSLDLDAQLKIPWTQLSPSDIRVTPFPTREYTDNEFQSIVKKVMGVLYVNSISLFSWGHFDLLHLYMFSSAFIILFHALVYWFVLCRYLLGFLYPISRLISYSVLEKVYLKKNCLFFPSTNVLFTF